MAVRQMLNSEISMKAISPRATKEAPFKKRSLIDVNSGSLDSSKRKMNVGMFDDGGSKTKSNEDNLISPRSGDMVLDVNIIPQLPKNVKFDQVAMSNWS